MLDDSRGEIELKIIDLESSIIIPEGLDQVSVSHTISHCHIKMRISFLFIAFLCFLQTVIGSYDVNIIQSHITLEYTNQT